MASFVGRKNELALLRGLLSKNTASLAVIYGRRRIGKSRLVEEFGQGQKMIAFAGLAPQGHTTRQSQIDEFIRQMEKHFPSSKQDHSDWGSAFSELARQVRKEKIIIFFDEISWIGSCDPDFLGKLKNAWDMEFKQNDKLILILCGSISSWINKNLLSSTGFYGRISLKIQLKDLSLPDCNQLLISKNPLISNHEKLKVLSVTGGIPKYLEEVNFNFSAEENIKQLCFLPSGLLFSDYDYIFSALVQKESEYYRKIISLIDEKSLEQKEISEKLDKESGGTLSNYLDELVISGFIDRDYSWNLKSGNLSSLSKYRLADNYLRFYLKYIKPNSQKIKNNQFLKHSLSALPAWSTIMGFQMENMVVNNRDKIKEILGIYPDEVVYDSPYFQRKTARNRGCQIDYMVQTKFGNLFVCEVKFSRNTIRMDIVDDMIEKIKNMSIPKNFSIRPVLIHVSEVSDEVSDSNYFSNIIDIADLLSS